MRSRSRSKSELLLNSHNDFAIRVFSLATLEGAISSLTARSSRLSLRRFTKLTSNEYPRKLNKCSVPAGEVLENGLNTKGRDFARLNDNPLGKQDSTKSHNSSVGSADRVTIIMSSTKRL